MIKYELKKIFVKKSTKIIILVVFILAVIISMFASRSVIFVNEFGDEYRNISSCRNLVDIKNEWQGELSDDVLHEVIRKYKNLINEYPKVIPNDVYSKELQPYLDIVEMINSVLIANDEYDSNAVLGLDKNSDVYAIRENNINKIIAEYGKTELQKEYLENIYNTVQLPLYYEANDSFDTLFRYAGMFALILVLLVTMPVATIFSDEFMLKADSVFYSSRFGRSRAIKNKIMTGFIVASIIYLCGMLTMSIISFSVMGISGYNVLHQFQYSYSIYNMTMVEEYILIVLCGFVAVILSSSISMLMAAKTQKIGLAIFLPFLFFSASPFIGRVLKFKNIFELTPDNLINIDNLIKIPNIYQLGSIVFRQVSFLVVFYTLVSLMLVPIIYRIYSNRYKMKY